MPYSKHGSSSWWVHAIGDSAVAVTAAVRCCAVALSTHTGMSHRVGGGGNEHERMAIVCRDGGVGGL